MESQKHAAYMQQETPTIDYLGVLWRQRLLLLFGTVLGLGLGYLWYTKQPPVYRSQAEIQITSPNTSQNLPIEGLAMQANANPLGDELRVIRSELVLRIAAELGDLSKTKTFSGMSHDSIAASLSASGALSLDPVNGNAMGMIVVSYSCGDPNESQRIVQSVVDAYSKHLQSQHRNVGEETLGYIDEARGEVKEKLDKLEKEYDLFKQRTPLVNRGGTQTSLHRENADRWLTEKQKLMIERTTLFGQQQAIRSAIETKHPPEAILAMLRNALGESLLNDADVADETNQSNLTALGEIKLPGKVLQTGAKRSEQMRQGELFQLKLKEKEFLSTLAPSHPAVVSLQIKIKGVEELIAELEESERNLEKEMEKELAKLRADAEKTAKARLENASTPVDPAAELQRQIDIRKLALDQRLQTLDQQLIVIGDAYNIEREYAKNEESAEIQAAGFERDIARQRDLYERILARLDEIHIVSDFDGRVVSVLNSAKRGWQTAPSLSRNLTMGCFLGLMGAAGIGYLREWLDKTYHGPEEIAEHLQMPVIGQIPAVVPDMDKVAAMNAKLDPSLCTFYQPRSTFSEAYRAIRTALYFSNRSSESTVKVIQVTSAVPSDGKSTIIANLAVTAAQSGKNVLLIDCDFDVLACISCSSSESEKRLLGWLRICRIITARREPIWSGKRSARPMSPIFPSCLAASSRQIPPNCCHRISSLTC
ncbi:MAG: Wzz/FepE/Etk N-terminal domain-containing protein [Pirellulaceae bacterium]